MVIKSAIFVKSAVKPPQYPEPLFPEIAFAGRSNVGKSSLINSLLSRKRLVKTSRTPGRTQLINFFIINEAFYFVDLPGYGYAKVPPKIKKQWGPMVEAYLFSRKNLQAIILAMDIRRTPGDYEKNLLHWFRQLNLKTILVLTKADKLSKNRQMSQQSVYAKSLFVRKDSLFLFSAKNLQGKDHILDTIEKILFDSNLVENAE
ncbi:MAG: ribosome biogenesis GTP-binding protein YihA/YsxC [Desulfobacterales bacterium]